MHVNFKTNNQIYEYSNHWNVGLGGGSLSGRNDEEKAAEEHAAELLHKNGYSELGIKDVIKTISTKGFSAV